MKRKPTKRSPEGQRALTQFQQEFCHRAPCWHCGKVCETLDVHHIVKRRGKIYDDRRNFFAACRSCHARIEGARLVFPSVTLQPIPLAVVLRIKREKDGRYWDLDFLRELSGRLDFGEGLK